MLSAHTHTPKWLKHKNDPACNARARVAEELREDLTRIETEIKDEMDKMRGDDVMQSFVDRVQKNFRSEFQSTINNELEKVRAQFTPGVFDCGRNRSAPFRL